MFIVEDKPYSMRPSFKKLSGSLYNPYPSHRYLQSKYDELKKIKPPFSLWGSTDQAHNDKIIEKTAQHLGFSPKAENILELGFHLEEDIVIMHKGTVQACFVAFPSGWDPGSKLTMSLENIHRPVADGDMLVQASSKISDIMTSGEGPWCRYVWTLTANPNLSNHPSYSKIEAASIDDLYFRYEYQTFDTVEIGSTSVFLIKTVVVPLREYVDTDEKFRIIKNSISSMSDAVLEYKNLRKIKELLWQ